MSKGEDTRERIIQEAGEILNLHGYCSTPISEIMLRTGMKKGGLYNHFESKEALAIEAFRFNTSTLSAFFHRATDGVDDPVDRLRRLIAAARDVAADTIVPGGCPILNAAVESDDLDPELRAEAASSARRLRQLFKKNIDQAKESREFGPDVDSGRMSFTIFASLEGGIMLSRLLDDATPIDSVIRSLNEMLDAECRKTGFQET